MLRLLLLPVPLLVANAIVVTCNAFTFPLLRLCSPQWKLQRNNPTTLNCVTNSDDSVSVEKTITTSYETALAVDKSSSISWLRGLFRSRLDSVQEHKLYRFRYDYNEMILGNSSKYSTTAVMLIHPIGVGIGKWYYDRLLKSLQRRYGDIEHQLTFLAPDLLGSATASGPADESGETIAKIPLLNITDWTSQVTALMAEYETKSKEEGCTISSWSVVANGGCSPIALGVASASLRQSPPFRATLTNVILSSPPRLPFFIESTDPVKVRKSYRTLSGMAGKLFWWYSLRRDGRFIQKFSERNLVGDAHNLGKEWTPNCLEAAKLHGGLSRYSTFAFLAGTLQDGCVENLNALRGSGIALDFIRGTDRRRNRARSWFWQRRKKGVVESSSEKGGDVIDAAPTEDTIQQYVRKNGNRGGELFVKGRISLAWEDSNGYAQSLMEHLCE